MKQLNARPAAMKSSRGPCERAVATQRPTVMLRLVLAMALSLCAAQAAVAENRWGNSQNAWGNAKNPWANSKNAWGNAKNPWADSQNSWGRAPSPITGNSGSDASVNDRKPSNYGGFVTVPSGPIVQNPNMTPRYVNSGDIPDGLRSPQRPIKRKVRKAEATPLPKAKPDLPTGNP